MLRCGISLVLMCLQCLNETGCVAVTFVFVHKDHFGSSVLTHTLHGLLLQNFGKELENVSRWDVSLACHFLDALHPSICDFLSHRSDTLAPQFFLQGISLCALNDLDLSSLTIVFCGSLATHGSVDFVHRTHDLIGWTDTTNLNTF